MEMDDSVRSEELLEGRVDVIGGGGRRGDASHIVLPRHIFGIISITPTYR